jgi:hypothetical protein
MGACQCKDNKVNENILLTGKFEMRSETPQETHDSFFAVKAKKKSTRKVEYAPEDPEEEMESRIITEPEKIEETKGML